MQETKIVKEIKNEQWNVSSLIEKIENKQITKPKFQRKKKWEIKPKKNCPNEFEYIEFLYKTKHSVHAITFADKGNNTFSNIDGNNRINAIKHYMDKPFDIFDKYLDDLFDILKDINSTKIEEIKNFFKSLSYKEFTNIKRINKLLKVKGKGYLFTEIKDKEDEIEEEIDNITKKLKINGEKDFHSEVKISINSFIGYDLNELSKIFEEINKYNTNLTSSELLASQLFNENNFEITDDKFKIELITYIKEYYDNKSEGEALECYEYKNKSKINAYDFIIGFQNLINKKYVNEKKDYKYNHINHINDNKDGIPLFFKLFHVSYRDYIFTTENVNKFIEEIIYSFNILDQTISDIFTDKINDKLFNSSCKTKITSLKKNNLCVIISSIIGYYRKNTKDEIIKKSLKICLLYHFFVNDLKNKDIKDNFAKCDVLVYTAGGGVIENKSHDLLNNPKKIINEKLDKKKFSELLNSLFNECNDPYKRKNDNGKNNNDKRRPLKFFEKTIMFYYYRKKIPIDILENNTFSIEHIFPNSSNWDGDLDKDRTGNLIPIIASLNSSRGNKHINNYKESSNNNNFFEYVKNVIPFDDYDEIINHNKISPKIIDNQKYNDICEKNEKTYNECFTEQLFD